MTVYACEMASKRWCRSNSAECYRGDDRL